jgi:hypothetical protein
VLTYHDIDLVHSTLADCWRHQLRHLAISQVYMGVERRRQLNLRQLGELHVDVACVVRLRDVVLSRDFWGSDVGSTVSLLH